MAIYFSLLKNESNCTGIVASVLRQNQNTFTSGFLAPYVRGSTCAPYQDETSCLGQP